MLRRTLGLQMNTVTGGWEKLSNEQFRNLYCLNVRVVGILLSVRVSESKGSGVLLR